MNADLLGKLDKRIERQLERLEKAQSVHVGTAESQAREVASEAQALEALMRAARSVNG